MRVIVEAITKMSLRCLEGKGGLVNIDKYYDEGYSRRWPFRYEAYVNEG
jgi:hypothetical protein